MIKRKKTPKAYNSRQIAEMARSLRLVADRLEGCASVMGKESIESLQVASWRSGELAVKHYQSFSRSIHSAVDTALLSRPLE